MLIETLKQYDAMLSIIKDEPILALDTEFIFKNTYYPILCLLQLSTPKHNYIIDVLKIKNLKSLFTKLYNKTDLWVLHSGYQDIQILYQYSGCLPKKIFDTQIASALLDLGWQISYQNLCKLLLKQTIDKTYTRFDWQKRPLPDTVLHYALADVAYLIPLYQILNEQLNKDNKRTWLFEEAQYLIKRICEFYKTENLWQQLSGIHKLKRHCYPLAYQLALWRVQTAMRKNKPKQWILKDEIIIAMASGEKIIPKNIHNALPKSASIELKLTNYKLNSTQQEKLKGLRQIIAELASLYHFDINIIGNKKTLIEYLKGKAESKLNSGWRRQILAAYKDKNTIQID